MERLIRSEWEERQASMNAKGAVSSKMMQAFCDRSHPFETVRYFELHRDLVKEELRADRSTVQEAVRRCLEVALSEALSANYNRASEAAIPDWEEGENLATAANAAMKALLTWMSQPAANAWQRQHDRDAKVLAIFNAASAATYLNALDVEARTTRARAAANALLDAQQFLEGMGGEYRAHRNSIVKPYEGTVEKTAFVRILCEGWTYICGAVPGVADSKFLKFVDAAWTDIGGRDIDPDDEETFTTAARTAIKDFKASADFRRHRPFWL